MPEGDWIAWFSSQSIWTQVFFVIFVVFIGMPIATLTVMQFWLSLRGLGNSVEDTKDESADKGKD